MLTESEVIGSVCDFLKVHGFRVTRQLCEIEHGIDIEALAPDGQRVSIEAKGETSSKAYSNRYGKAFTGSQTLDHVSKALYCAARDCPDRLAGIALPHNTAHLNCIEKILPALRTLQIEVFWVLADRSVEIQRIWKIWSQVITTEQSD